MEAARRPASSEGLSAFLVEHDACGAGFDVSHPAGLGNGSLRITCLGCRAAFDYLPRVVEVEREIEIEPVRATVTPLPVGQEKESLPVLVGSPPRPPRLRLPRERIVTVALIAFAVAVLIYGGIRIAESGGDNDSKPAREAPAAAATPAPEPAPAATAPRSPGTGKASAVGAVRVRTPLFSLVVPGSWANHGNGAATVYSPTGAARSTSIRVFYEKNPAIDREAMAASTARLLGRRVDGRVGTPRFLRSGGNPAFTIRARGPRGSQTALGVLSGQYRFLAIASAANSASAVNRAALRRALDSFRAN